MSDKNESKKLALHHAPRACRHQLIQIVITTLTDNFMKRIAGHKLALVGLFAGLMFGLAVTSIKHWLSNEIADAIDDEVRIACPTCSLAFDTFTLSFTTLSGKATNVRILNKGVAKLTFAELRGTFSLAEILERRIYLTSLTLRGGYADGVGPDSETFKFIDQLTAPIPPELDRPGRLRVVLDRLEIQDAKFREPLGKDELLGNDVGLVVERQGEAFLLTPTIADLRFRSYHRATKAFLQELNLGNLSAQLVIDDGVTTFRDLRVGRDRSQTKLNGTLNSNQGNQCSAKGTSQIETAYIGLPEWLTGYCNADVNVVGHISSPILSGTLTGGGVSGGGDQLGIIFPYATPLLFPAATANYEIDIRKGSPLVTVRDLFGQNENATLSSLTPLTFSSEGLAASFQGSAKSFDYGPFSVKDASIHLKIFPKGENTATHIELTVGNLLSNGIWIGPSVITLDILAGELIYDVKNTSTQQGSFHATGTILLPDESSSRAARLKDGALFLDKFRYPTSLPVTPEALSPVALSGAFDLAGPIDLMQLTGGGNVMVTFPLLKDEAPASGTAILRDGYLSVDLPNTAYGGKAKMRLDLARNFTGSFQATLSQSSLSHFVSSAECSDLVGSMEYQFALNKPLEGNGSIGLDTLTLGCAPYQLAVTGVKKLPIKNGALQVEGLSVIGVNSSLKLKGSMGVMPGYNVGVQGNVYLSALLPFLPAVDNLQGTLSTAVTIKGALSKPEISGSVALSRGEIGIISPELTIREVQGNFEMQKDAIVVKDLRGLINDGELEVRGAVYPQDLTSSEILASFSDVTISPMENAILTLAGELSVRKGDNGNTILAGDIVIPSAEISRDIDPNKMLVQALTGYFFSNPTVAPKVRTGPANIELDLSINAARNIFVLTPFLSAEFNAHTRVQGTAAQPAISGEMEVLSGWIGLKDNRFDITSGSVSFKPGALEPILSIVGEGTLRSNTGENILVLLEANGPVSTPRVILTSDQGLSTEELLVLLTASRSLTGRTLANTVGRQLGLEQRFLLSPDSFDSFGSFFRSLTRIDSLSVEPIFNPFSGQTEPAVVGRKNIAERLVLAGQSTLGTIQNARAGFVYNLTPSLNASGFIETVPSRQNTALTADLTYTVLAQQSEFMKIDLQGNINIESSAILNSARIGPGSRVKHTEAVLENIARDISSFLYDQGFASGEVNVSCLEGDDYCAHLAISINEGELYRVSALTFEGDALPNEAKQAIEGIEITDRVATSTLLQQIESALLIAVRNEGYVAARITVSRGAPIDSSHLPLTIKVELREPVSFTFSGNSVFKPREFLDSIDLFKRKRPFGNNTIQLLVQNISRMYQDEGYLFAKVHYTSSRNETGRVTFNISVDEGPLTNVRTLNLEGNEKLSKGKIINLMKEIGYSQQLALLKPSYAVTDQLEALKDTLVSIYQHEGFPEAAVSYEVIPTDSKQAVDIIYTITEGDDVRINSLNVRGYPNELPLPSLPSTPTSIPRINKYITILLDNLRDNGFLAPTVSASPGDEGEIEITVESGVRTFIESVFVDGLSKITQRNIQSYLTLDPGQPLIQESINETKRLLLRSGLFSRVEIEPMDGKLDSEREKITIRVVERPLRTLEVGGGANSEFGIHVFGEAVDKGLFSDGQSLALRLDSYFSNQSVDAPQGLGVSQGFSSLRYVNPNLLGTNLSFSEELRYQRQDVTTFEFNQDRLSLASYVYTPLSRGLTLSAGHTVLLDDLSSVSPGAVLSELDTGTTRLGYLSAVLSLDRRDDPLIPQSGYTFTLEPKLASSALGSEADYGSILSRASTILPLEPLSPRFSLALSGAAGASFTYGDTPDIPITQRFYLGGRTTVRGFRENSLGPRSDDGAVIGGDTLVMLKTQLQYLAAESITTHVFLDAGNVFLRDESFNLDDTRKSVGIGFRFLSPIGPLGMDIGHPLDEKGGEPSFRLHFSVGSSF